MRVKCPTQESNKISSAEARIQNTSRSDLLVLNSVLQIQFWVAITMIGKISDLNINYSTLIG